MDKKIKKAAEKITMPEDMKERIIKACEASADKNIIRNDNDGYADEVSGTERIEPKRRILQTVSAVAACAVLAAGIGTTGVLLHKNHRSQLAGSEDVDAAESRSCPFGDFNTFKYSFEDGNVKYVNYYDENNGRLSDFLNTFDWGEPVEDTSGRGDEIVVTDYAYNISWEENRVVSWLYIADDGFVSYSANKYSEDYLTSDEVERRSYSIDFEAFDKGLQNILAQDVYISQEEADRLLSGSFVLSELTDSNNVRIEPDRAEAKEMLNEFLRDGFIYMLKRSVPDNASEGYNLKYSVMLEFKTDDGQRHTENFTIYENGVVSSSEYMGTGNDLLPYTADNYSINIEEFESRLRGILGDDEFNTGNTAELGERCETDGWEYLIKSVDVTKSGDGMDVFSEGHYACDEKGDLIGDSSYIIADIELTNNTDEDRSLYMNSTRVDLYNYNGDELDFKNSMEATAYIFNGDRSVYEADYFKTDFKAGERRTFRVGYVIDDEYLDKSFDTIRIEINHSGMAEANENIRYYRLGEKKSLNDIAKQG